MLLLTVLLALGAIPFLIIYYVLYVVLIIIYQIFALVFLIIRNLPFVLFASLLIFSGVLWFMYNGEVVTNLDVLIRCDFAKYYNEEWRELINALASFYEQIICWLNALSHWNRFFTNTFLAKEFAQCQAEALLSSGGYYASLKVIFVSIINGFTNFVLWFFTGLFTDVLPVYNILLQLVPGFENVNLLLNCICNDIRPLFDFAIRVLSNEALFCTLHYYLNSILTILQTLLVYGVNLVTELFMVIFSGQSFDQLIDLLFRTVVSLSLPDLTFAAERAYAGALSLGNFFDNILLIAGCTIASEIDGNMDVQIIYPAYDSCYQNRLYRVPFFKTIASLWAIVVWPSWNFPSSLSVTSVITGFSPTFGIGYRLYDFLYSIIIHWFQAWDPNQEYLASALFIDRFIDSLRDPPARMNTTSTIWSIEPSAELIVEYISYGIELPPFIDSVRLAFTASDAYGDNFNGGASLNTLNTPKCINQYASNNQEFTSVPCFECGDFGNYSFQFRLCNLARTLDELIFGQTGTPLLSDGQARQIFQPILCCAVGRALRLVISVLNFPVSLIRHWTNIAGFLEDDRWLQSIFDELGGRQNQLGGLIQCVYNLFAYTFEPRLRCFAGIIVYPAKAISELVRSLLLFFPRLVATIRGSSSQQNENFETYLCLDTVNNVTCFGIESAIQWLRPPRSLYTTNYTNQFNATVSYQPLLPSNSPLLVTNETFIDCLCNIINLKFISDFLGYDVLDGVDLCCGIQFGVRAITEAIKFVFQLVIVLLQTFYGFTTGTGGRTFLFLEWLACTSATILPVGSVTSSDFYCSNIVALFSDLEDFLNCPCVFFIDIEIIVINISGAPSNGFNCLCQFIDGIAKVILALGRSVIAFILGLVKITSCLIKEDVPLTSSDCTDELTQRFIESFTFIDISLDSINEVFQGLGCLIGSVFGFADGGFCIRNTVDPCPIPNTRCFIGDKLGSVLSDISSALVSVIQAFLNIFIGLLNATLTGASAAGVVPLSFTQFLQDIIQGIVGNLWGVPGPPITNGALQNLGIFLNCAFGPESCGSVCSGSVFIIIGDEIRSIWGDPETEGLSCVIFNLLFVFETLFFQTQSNTCFSQNIPAGSSCSQLHITNFITCFFELIFKLLFSPTDNIFSFFLDIIKAIVNLIPGVGSTLAFIITIFQTFVNFLVSVGSAIIKYIICLVTTGDLANNGDCPATQPLKRTIRFGGDDNFGFGSKELKERIKKAKRMVMDSFPVFNSTESKILSNVETLLSTLDKNSYCYKAIDRTIRKYETQNPGKITLEEELIFKLCYGFTIFPYFYNAMSRDYALSVSQNTESIEAMLNLTSTQPNENTANNQKRQQGGLPPGISSLPEYQYGNLPYDMLINPITGLTLTSNMVLGFGYYVQWLQRPMGKSLFDPVSKTFTSSFDIDDFSTNMDLSDPLVLKSLLQGDLSLVNSKKRQYSEYNTSSILADSLYQGISFGDYLSEMGIDCPYTESFFRSIDSLQLKTTALTLFNLRSSALFTSSFRKLQNVGLSVKRSEKRTSLLKNTGVPNLDAGKRTTKTVENRIQTILKSYLTGFVKQQETFREAVKALSIINDGNIHHLMQKNGYNFSYFHFDPHHHDKNGYNPIFFQPRLLGDNTILGPQKTFQFEKPPVFIIPKSNDHNHLNKKRNVDPNRPEVRVPIFTMINYLYRTSFKFVRLYYTIGLERMKQNFINRPEDQWSVFKRQHILESAINSPRPTSMENIYKYTKSVVTKYYHQGDEPIWSMDDFIKEIELGRVLNQKRQAGAGNLGCRIFDTFINETIEIFSYCSDRYSIRPDGTIFYNETFVASLPRFIPFPLAIIPFNTSAPTTGIVASFPFIGTIYEFFGYDLLNSFLNFVTEINVNPVEGEVGLFYFIFRFMYTGKCIRGVDDRCLVGYGIPKALLIILLIGLILAVLFLFFNPIASLIINAAILLGGFFFLVSLFLTLAFGYNMACAQPGGSTLLFGTIIPITLSIPTIPECAGPEVDKFLESIVNAPCGLIDALQPLVKNGSCIHCDSSNATFGSSTNQFIDCGSLGFDTLASVIVNDIYILSPDIIKWLNGTCLIRGGCFLPSTRSNLANYDIHRLPKLTSFFSFLIPSETFLKLYNNNSNTNGKEQIDACLSILWPTRIALYLLVILILTIFVYTFLQIIFTILWAILMILIRIMLIFSLVINNI